MQELIAEQATAMPGVEESIAMARAEGLALGLATSSAPPLIEAVLTTLDLGDVFAITHSAIERGTWEAASRGFSDYSPPARLRASRLRRHRGLYGGRPLRDSRRHAGDRGSTAPPLR